MNIAVTAVRTLQGLIFFVFGINGISKSYFFPLPPPPPAVGNLFSALGQTTYFFPLLSLVYLVAGCLLLSGWFVPLGLILLAPIIVNIIFIHIFLDLAGIIPGVVVLAFEVFLAWAYRSSFRSVLNMRAMPD